MKELANKVVVITGASSGIGAALAREFSKEGAKLALLARRLDRLESLQEELTREGGQCIAIKCDVTQENEIRDAFSTIHGTFGTVDIAIANAGYAVHSKVEDLKMEDIHRQFNTNVFGVLHTFYASLEDLKQTHGNFVIIGSVAGFISVPKMGIYSMSKYSVRALAEVLHVELAPYGIHTTYVAPGYVETEIHKIDKHGVYHANARHTGPKNKMPADVAARKIIAAIKKNKKEIIITNMGKVAKVISRLPINVVNYLMRHRK